jgi:two-component system response regulator AtoC
MAAPTVHLSGIDGPRKTETDGTLHLTVMAANVFSTFPLPEQGAVTIGRDDSADIRITDEGASRPHARLHIAADGALYIEDLKSSNGTYLRDQRLQPGDRVELKLGEAVTIGYTIVMVQRRRAPALTRRMHSHATFEERLEDACERASNTGAMLAVVRIRLEDSTVGDRASRALAEELRAGDVLAQYAPGEYEVLLLDTEPARARALAEELSRRLAVHGIGARSVTAQFPADGRTAGALIGATTAMQRGLDRASDSGPILSSDVTRKLYRLAERAAAGQTANGLINVLVLGETGAGKEVLADYIHRRSPRASGPYVCINCAALSENLLESELFGYERGAFTGATQTKAGLLESAQGGTVFLDEIGEMPASLQTKLLRAIENREITRVGALKSRPIDVRFIAATNRDLEADVERQGFRRDLYFRLNGISLTIPPLRDRVEEIEPLAQQFLLDATAAGPPGRRVPRLSPEAIEILRGYSWPGNIRELRNVIERALVLCDSAEITTEHLPVEKMRPHSRRANDSTGGRLSTPVTGSPLGGPALPPGLDLSAKDLAERERIFAALAECAGSQTSAAEKLGISRGTLIARLKRLAIPRPRAGRSE